MVGRWLFLSLENKCGGQGECTCSLKPLDVRVRKETNIGSAQDFVSYTHESIFPFNLYYHLGGNNHLRNGYLYNVTNVTVYYWKKDSVKPLLIEVTKSTRCGSETEYYYKYDEAEGHDEKYWEKSNDRHDIQDRLDDLNCKLNNAIPFDIKNPTSSSGISKSQCIKRKRVITESQPHTIPGGQYTVKAYNIGGVNTKISRVTYSNLATRGIEPPEKSVTSIRVYSWSHNREIPLLLKIVKQRGGSTWFANTGTTSITWTNIRTQDSTGFYDTTGSQPTSALTDKLDLLNCQINNVVQIDFSQIGFYIGDPKPSCHTGHAGPCPNRIFVKNVANEPPYDDKLDDFKIYKHISKSVYTPGDKFHIVGIKSVEGSKITLNNSSGKGTPDSPIKDVKEVHVFFTKNHGPPKGTPLLIYCHTTGSPGHNWFRKPEGFETTPWPPLEDPNINGKDPKTVASNGELLKLLDQIVRDCTPSVTIQIDKRIIGEEDSSSTYTYSSPPNKKIDVKKQHVLFGFTEYIHIVQGCTRCYTVTGFQYNGKDIPALTETLYVKSVSVYYWTALENANKEGTPLLVKVTQRKGTSITYNWFENTGKDGDNTDWKSASGLSNSDVLQEKLDDLNCKLNKAIVFVIKNPESGSSSDSVKRKRVITESRPVTPDSQYTVKSYDIGGEQTRISRVTYEKIFINTITPPKDPVTNIRVYYWKHAEGIPLLIEFVRQRGGTLWFANTSKASITWTNIRTQDSIEFYQGTEPQDVFTKKLDLLNCQINNVVQIDFSQAGFYIGDPKPSCHTGYAGPCPNRIFVKDVTTEEPYNPANLSSQYIIYKHVSKTLYSPGATFHIVGIVNPNGRPNKITLQGGGAGSGTPDSPIKDVKEIHVLFSNDSPNTPLLVYYKTAGDNHHWYRKPEGPETTPWIPASSLNGQKSDTVAGVLKNLLAQIAKESTSPKVTDSGPVA